MARSPVDVLAGRGPESDRRHFWMCICGEVVEVSRKRCGRGMAGGGGPGALMLAGWLAADALQADLLSTSALQWLGLAGQEQADYVAPTYTYGIAVDRLSSLSLVASHTHNNHAIVHIGPTLGPPELCLSLVRCRQQLAGRR